MEQQQLMEQGEPGADGSPSYDEENAGNRKPRMTRTPQERISAVQEKNRRAQKRFRERQKVSKSSCRLNVCDGVTKPMS